jgi:hypothetical protein
MKKVIGIGGVARSGKDTFAAILETKLQQAGRTAMKIALAGPLKQHCDKFLTENLGISAFTQVPEEKLIIRPLLVWYGDAQRKRTNGKYWTDLASKTINETNFDYYIITDIRYDVFERDELQWLKDDWKGTLCHISKYITQYQVVPPANEHEAVNDPKIKASAHHIVEWPHVNQTDPLQLLTNPTLNEYVDTFIQQCKVI